MKISQATRRDNGHMVYLVQSEENANHWHIVWRTENGFQCSCKSYKYGHKASCKHTVAVKQEICAAMLEIGAKWLPPMKLHKPAPVVSMAAKRESSILQTTPAFSFYKAS